MIERGTRNTDDFHKYIYPSLGDIVYTKDGSSGLVVARHFEAAPEDLNSFVDVIKLTNAVESTCLLVPLEYKGSSTTRLPVSNIIKKSHISWPADAQISNVRTWRLHQLVINIGGSKPVVYWDEYHSVAAVELEILPMQARMKGKNMVPAEPSQEENIPPQGRKMGATTHTIAPGALWLDSLMLGNSITNFPLELEKQIERDWVMGYFGQTRPPHYEYLQCLCLSGSELRLNDAIFSEVAQCLADPRLCLWPHTSEVTIVNSHLTDQLMQAKYVNLADARWISPPMARMLAAKNIICFIHHPTNHWFFMAFIRQTSTFVILDSLKRKNICDYWPEIKRACRFLHECLSIPLPPRVNCQLPRVCKKGIPEVYSVLLTTHLMSVHNSRDGISNRTM